MPKTQFNVEQFKNEAVKPLFAVAGATELAVDFARGYATEAQKSAQDRIDAAQARVTKVDFRDTKAIQAKFEARVDELTKEAKDAQAKFEARVADLQKDAKDLPAKVQKQLEDAVKELVDTYADLAARGEKFVAAIRKDGVKAVTAKPAKAAKKPAAKKAPVKKAAAKKAPAKKAPAKKVAAKKAPAKKSA